MIIFKKINIKHNIKPIYGNNTVLIISCKTVTFIFIVIIKFIFEVGNNICVGTGDMNYKCSSYIK